MSRKVLLVDDEPDVLLATRLLLQTAGYSVLEAKTGEEALALVEEGKPDAIFLDLRMPGMDGWDVLAELRARGYLERIPVIVLSAHGSPGRVEQSLELGAKAYVRKPFRKADLTRALDAVLDARPAP
jgi:CheY-like chemotaxis protein